MMNPDTDGSYCVLGYSPYVVPPDLPPAPSGYEWVEVTSLDDLGRRFILGPDSSR